MTEAAAARYLARQTAAIERALDLIVPNDPARLRQAVRYSLLGGGKRVRPLLTLATGRLLGAPAGRVMPVACALELVHAYSLVHDDLPAMDDDDLRRGRPTTHKVFGEGVAILVGDALLTEAFGVIAGHARLEPRRRLRAIAELAEAAGERGMVGGQALDLEAAGGRVGLARIQEIHRRKTGALLRAAVRLGAIVAGAPTGALGRLTTFGEELGLAFQIIDDVLDATGDGPDGRTDVALAKATYPAVTSMAEARQEAERAGAAAEAAIEPFGGAAEPLRLLARRVVERVGAAS